MWCSRIQLFNTRRLRPQALQNSKNRRFQYTLLSLSICEKKIIKKLLLFKVCCSSFVVQVLLFKFCCSSFVVQVLLFKFCCSSSVVQVLLFKFSCSSFVVQVLLFKFCCSSFVVTTNIACSTTIACWTIRRPLYGRWIICGEQQT